MGSLQTHIDPVSTKQILKDLSLAIDEAKVVRTLGIMKDRLYQIETQNGSTKSSESLKQEIASLEEQLRMIRDRADIY